MKHKHHFTKQTDDLTRDEQIYCWTLVCKKWLLASLGYALIVPTVSKI